MDSDNDSYHSGSDFYYPDEENKSNARVQCETASVKSQHNYFFYCGFQQHANSEVQSPTDDWVFRRRQS